MARLQIGKAKKRTIRMMITHSENLFFFILIHLFCPTPRWHHLISINRAAETVKKVARSMGQISLFFE
jgi:hypothetical protein